ncbi:MAG: hypothetical protein R2788_14260 [Saprospiraceae bacterium]
MERKLPRTKSIGQNNCCGLPAWCTISRARPKYKKYLDEPEFLAMTAGAECSRRVYPKNVLPHTRGLSSVREKQRKLKEYIEEKKRSTWLAFADDDPSGKQVSIRRNDEGFKIVCSSLISTYLPAGAQTAQAKTQVELAQLVPAPRHGPWMPQLERQKGGSAIESLVKKRLRLTDGSCSGKRWLF